MFAGKHEMIMFRPLLCILVILCNICRQKTNEEYMCVCVPEPGDLQHLLWSYYGCCVCYVVVA